MRDVMTAMRGAKDRASQRSNAYRERRRHGRVLVPVEVDPRQLAALERLALLDTGNRDKGAIAWAVTRFLETAPHFSAMGDALWPEGEEAE